MSALLTPIAIGATAVGAGGSILGGFQEEGAANQQARAFKQQAQLDLAAAGSQINAEDVGTRREIESGFAQTGASNLTQATAAPVLDETAAQQKIRDMYTRFSGQLASVNDLYRARSARYLGRQAVLGGLFGASRNLLGGVATIGRLG